MHGILDPAFLALFTAIGATIWFAATRERGAVTLVAAGAVTFFCGALIASLGSAHTVAVIGRALRGPSFVYNFRLYSLVLLGACQMAGGLRCLSTSWRVASGDARAWKSALIATMLLLIVNVPLIPIQGFAGATSMIAVVTLITLIAAGRRFVTQVDAETVTLPEMRSERA
jgi:hypothetical protein